MTTGDALDEESREIQDFEHAEMKVDDTSETLRRDSFEAKGDEELVQAAFEQNGLARAAGAASEDLGEDEEVVVAVVATVATVATVAMVQVEQNGLALPQLAAEHLSVEATYRRPRLTKKTWFVLGGMYTIDCINFNLLTPYVVRMVSDFLQTTPDDPSVAYVVGLLVGLYPLCEFLFSPLWGAFSDRVGRRPALLIGLGGSVAAPILFGLGTNLPTVFAARALDGFFSGNVSVTKTYLGEIVDETNEAKGFGFLAMCYGVGLLIGPMLGGELVYPARWAPSVFADTIFEEHPFLLPNLTYAVLAAVAWILAAAFLEETLHRSEHVPPGCCGGARRDASGGFLPTTRFPMSSQVSSSASEANQQAPLSIFVLVQVVICYCALSGWSAAAEQLYLLIVSFPRSVDGFDLDPMQIGALQNVAAASLVVNQLFFYKLVTQHLGLFRSFVLGWTLSMTASLLLPVCGIWADPESFGFWRYVPLILTRILKGVGAGMVYPVCFTFVNRASAGRARGAVNGWVNSSGALCRAIYSVGAAFLLTWGNGMNEHWGRYVSVYANCLLATVFIMVALPGVHKADAWVRLVGSASVGIVTVRMPTALPTIAQS